MSDNSALVKSVLPFSKTIVTSDWVQELVSLLNNKTFNSAEIDLLILNIEQLLCMGATQSILNKFSNVSRRKETQVGGRKHQSQLKLGGENISRTR